METAISTVSQTSVGVLAETALAILEHLTDAAVIVDKDLKPIAWNSRYLQQVGLRQQQFKRRLAGETRCCDVLRLEVCADACLAKRVTAQRKPVRVDEIAGWTANNSDEKMTFIVNASPVVDTKGEVVGTLEVYRDVTAEARIQARYKALLDAERRRSESLEEQVKARTRELEMSIEELKVTRNQLIQAEKLSSLGQLVAGVAHEINNPTSFIYGNIRFLHEHVTALLKLIDFAIADGHINADARRELEQLKTDLELDYVREDVFKIIEAISTGAERVTAIVRDLRRYVHNGATGDLSRVDLGRCIDTALSLMQLELRGRHEVERLDDPDVPRVFANEGQLSQVFINLVSNAVHAIKGKGHIKVRVMKASDGATVEITDNGVGIPEENLLKIFDPFFTTKPVGEGTGMGLAIAHSIIDRHRGSITVRSQVGVGTTFSVWIPAAP